MKYARKAVDTLPAGDENSGVQFMLAGVIPMGAIFLESYVTMPWHVMIRFGKWDEILAEPMYERQGCFPSHHCNPALRTRRCLCIQGNGSRGRSRTGPL